MDVRGARVLASGLVRVTVVPALVIVGDPAPGHASAPALGTGAGSPDHVAEVPPGQDIAPDLETDLDRDGRVLSPGIARKSHQLGIYKKINKLCLR